MSVRAGLGRSALEIPNSRGQPTVPGTTKHMYMYSSILSTPSCNSPAKLTLTVPQKFLPMQFKLVDSTHFLPLPLLPPSLEMEQWDGLAYRCFSSRRHQGHCLDKTGVNNCVTFFQHLFYAVLIPDNSSAGVDRHRNDGLLWSRAAKAAESPANVPTTIGRTVWDSLKVALRDGKWGIAVQADLKPEGNIYTSCV